MYSSTLSLNSALYEVGDQSHAPAASLPGKRQGTHFIGGWVWMAAVNMPSQGLGPQLSSQ